MAEPVSAGGAVVLSVDDQESNRYARNRVLQAAGYRIIEAATGAEALRMAACEQPALVVLDIRLPDLNGFEVCERLKSDPVTEAIPVLHVSALGRAEQDFPEALKHRSDAYLREPIDPDTLVATANALIRAREAERRQREAEERAREAERHAANILDSIADPVVAFDREWRYTYVSRQAAEVLGKAPGEMIGRSMWEMFPEDVETGFQEGCRRAWAEARPVTLERYSNVLGVWVESYIYPFGDGAATQWRDITERKRAEELIGFREAFDHLPIEVAVYEGPEHRLVYANPAADANQRPSATPPRSPYFDRAYLHGETVRISAASDGRRYVNTTYSPLRRGGKVAGVIVTSVDVTDALRKEQLFRRFVEDNTVGVVIGSVVGPDKGRLTLVNDAYLNLIGYTRAEFEAGEIRWDRITPPESQAADDAGIAEALREGKARPYEKEYIHKDGHRIPILVAPAWIPGTDEVMSFVVDLTERKRAEQALRESEERLRESEARLARTQEFSLVMALHVGLDGTWLKLPPTFARFLGYGSEADLLGRHFRDVTHPEDFPADWSQVERLLRGETKSFEMEKRFLRKDGSVTWGYLNCSIVTDEEGRPVHLLTYVRDINAQKRAEEALRESEQRYRTLFTSLNEGFGLGEVIYDSAGAPVDHRFLEINDAFRRQTGISGDIVGRTAREILPNVEPAWHEIYHRVVQTGEPVRFQQYDTDTSRHYNVFCYSPTRGRFAILFRDITGEKRAEEALRRSEARLSTALEHLGEGVVIAGEEGEVFYWNAAARAMHGYAGPAVERRPLNEFAEIFQLWTADGARQIPFEEWPMMRIMRGEIVRNLELRLRRPDQGWERIVSFYGAMLESSTGERLIYLSIYDLTAQRRAEQELRDRERQFRELADSAPQLVWVTEPDGSHVYFNRQWYEQLGVGPEESLGGRWADLLHPEDRRRTVAYWHSCLATGEPYEIEYRFRVASGEYRWFLGRAVPFRDEQGRITRWYGTCTDIEESKRAEERLRQTQKLESVGLLAGGIAHDFNNLLTGIMGNASMVLEDVGPGPAAERIGDIVTSAQRAAALTRQLLAYSGKGQFVVRELDVSQAVNEMADLVQFSIPKSVDLALNVQKRLPMVRMDPGQLQQILMNLVINAGEAIGEGSPGRVTVSTSMRDFDTAFVDAVGQEVVAGRYVCVEVSDTGAGIGDEARSRIFDPFFTTKFVGRGLGLAAVAGIVRSHNGGITLESERGRGSMFRVLLPVAEARAAEEQLEADGRATVLVVDDEASVRDFIAAALLRKGYRVLTASDGREALAAFDREDGRIDALVLDVVMPVMSANELLPSVKERQPGTKILLTSGYSESEARRLCAAYPGAAFIQKPYTASQIAGAVEELIGGPIP